MVGHNGLFISIKNMENEKIVELYAKNSVVPAVLLNKSGDILDYMIQTEENNTVYRSISRRVAVTPEQGKSKHVIITVCHGYWVSHPVYGQTQYLAVLVQYRSGLYFCFLGWLTTRIGLKPLREMTSLASSMTVHSLDQRLNPIWLRRKSLRPCRSSIICLIAWRGHSGNCQISRLTSRMSCAHSQ